MNNTTIQYDISILEPQTHQLNVKMKFSISGINSIQLQMPVWTPGSYKIRDFSRHISNENIHIDGEETMFERLDKCTWEIKNSNNGREIQFEYKAYAHEMTVRTSFIDHTQAILNGASLFLYSPHLKNNNIKIKLNYPKKWKNIVTGLEYDNTNNFYLAENYDQLIDTPILIGNPHIHNFDIAKKPHTFAIVGKGNYDIKPILKNTKTIISEFKKIFNDLPYDKYAFITHLYDSQYGGLEHLNSCHIIFDRWQFKDRNKYIKFISLVAHEYFHTFNVKRIRPKELGPFNYQTEHYSKMLWLAEGVTSYYDEYILKRAGIINVKEYFDLLNLNFIRYFAIPGKQVLSTKDASFLAWIKLYIQDENAINTSISYYLTGGFISLILDLKLRELTNSEKSLDDVYKILWNKFKKSGDGVTENEFFQICKNVCGEDLIFIKKYLDTTMEIDFKSAFEPFGLIFTPSYKKDDDKTSSWIGVVFDPKDKLTIKMIKSNGPAWNSNLSPGDEIIAVNNSRLTLENKDKLLNTLQINTPALFLINRMGDIIELEIIPTCAPFNKFELKKVDKPQKQQIKLYENWLNCKWDDK
ncbi:MAG: M61 family metallopeptidase [Candidatus Marinimicrobia bacterium]|nr:M61 family metallopeptidase [Candidatus Neomarinimicrobiota bacterium]